MAIKTNDGSKMRTIVYFNCVVCQKIINMPDFDFVLYYDTLAPANTINIRPYSEDLLKAYKQQNLSDKKVIKANSSTAQNMEDKIVNITGYCCEKCIKWSCIS